VCGCASVSNGAPKPPHYHIRWGEVNDVIPLTHWKQCLWRVRRALRLGGNFFLVAKRHPVRSTIHGGDLLAFLTSFIASCALSMLTPPQVTSNTPSTRTFPLAIIGASTSRMSVKSFSLDSSWWTWLGWGLPLAHGIARACSPPRHKFVKLMRITRSRKFEVGRTSTCTKKKSRVLCTAWKRGQMHGSVHGRGCLSVQGLPIWCVTKQYACHESGEMQVEVNSFRRR